MEKDNLYFLVTKKEYILTEKNGLVSCLTDEDLSKLSLAGNAFIYNGTVEEYGVAVHSLFTIPLDEAPSLGKSLIAVEKEALFTQPMRPGDRMFLKQLHKGRKNIDLVVRYNDDKLVTAYDRVSFPAFKAFFLHLHTVNRHRRMVRRHCFRVGLYWQGLVHDLSKYSPTEFLAGVKYYQGTRSPNVAERNINGYSKAWMHHKGRNKHHYEYWTDYSIETGNPLEYMRMPRKYFVESIMDRIAASKIYGGAAYTDSDSLDYLLTRDSESHMNQEDRAEMLRILTMLSHEGEEKTFNYLKNEYLKQK